VPFNGSGTFVRVHNWTSDAANGIDINATEMDAEDTGFATGLSNCVTRDGQGKMGADFTPSVGNTFNLGTAALPWATLNGTPVSSLPVTAPAIGQIIYPQSAAEAAASPSPITPTIYVPTLQIDLERYGGGVGATATQNNTAWLSAMEVITAKGGGVLVMRGGVSGNQYAFGANTLSAAGGLILQGDGYNTVFKWSGLTASQPGLLVPHGSGRVELRDLILFGPGDGITGSGNAGWGAQIGDSTLNASFILMRKVQVNGWATGLLMGGSSWGRYEQCEFGPAIGNTLGNISNNVGIDFNFQRSGNQVTAQTFEDCVVSNNANNGIKGTNVSTAMNSINWKGLTCQNNCQSATGNPQFAMSFVQGFSMKGLYFEYVLGGTPPDCIDTTGAAYGSITDFYMSICATGIKDRSVASMTAVKIENGTISGATTAAINCTNETDLKVENVATAATITATNANGSVAVIASGAGVGNWTVNEASFTPAIAFGTSGSITQTVQAATYSRIGNTVTFSFRINWSAIASPSGAVTITGLPIAPHSGGPDVSFPLGYAQGLTISAGYLAAFIPNGSTTVSVYNVQTTTAALTGAAFAASGSLVCSGSYQV
jgi:hypothetical protein